MLVRILALASLSLALAAPAALAADGAPPPPGQGTTAAPAAAGVHAGGDAGKLAQRLADLRRRLELAGGAFAKHCASGTADTGRCTAAAKRLLAALQRVDARIDTVIGRIRQRCSTAATTTPPSDQPGATRAPCAHADQVVQVLQNVQAKIRDFEQKLQDWLGSQPSPGANGSNDGSSTTTTSSADSSLEGLDQLAGDLAAARDAAAQSGL